MTATYRRVIAWEHDGNNTHGHRGRKSRSYDKPIDRRIKRREHSEITRDAVRSFYVDGADDLYRYLDMEDYFEEYGFMEPEWDEHEDYIQEDYDYGYDYYDLGCDPHDDDDFPSYAPHPAYDPMQDYSIQREDVGRSLGDILEELLSKRRIQDPSRPEDGSLDGGDWINGDY